MARPEHCITCFEALDAELAHRAPMSLADIQKSYAAYKKHTTPPLTEAASDDATPLFVTWNSDEDNQPGEYDLRGCIGTFQAMPLATGLPTYALTAALEDTRFRPIARRELPHLQVAVTLLTDFEPARDALDWELGKHGLRIAFVAGGGQSYGATYLPDVAPEQGWTKEETVESLMRKAGWRGRGGPQPPWTQVSSFKTTRYQGAKRSMVYAEFKAWRDWADAQAKAGRS